MMGIRGAGLNWLDKRREVTPTMVVKQSPQTTCICSRPIEFPGGQVKTTCPCGAVYELGPEGFWFITSIVLMPAAEKLRADEYKRYPRCKKRRKAG